MSKADLEAVPQFLFPGNPEPVYPCVHLHYHINGICLYDRLQSK